MDDKLISKKVKALQNHYKRVVKKHLIGIDDVHGLRTKTRELISLIASKTPFYKRLKKIIKLSNEIRDIDVFHSLFLASLPKKCKKVLDITKIEKISRQKREAEIEQLLNSLEKLDLSEYIIIPKDHLEEKPDLHKPPLKLTQKKLHRYRIYIKTKLYVMKNRYPSKKKKIKIYTMIKDTLGEINDNFNAIKRLKSFGIGKKELRLIKKYVQKQNIDHFSSIEKLNRLI